MLKRQTQLLLRIIALLGAILWNAVGPPDAQAEDFKLVMGSEGNYPPMAILKPDGSLTGLEPELAREVCRRIKAECEIKSMDFSALLPSLVTGHLDVVIASVYPTEERKKSGDFTSPVIWNPLVFTVPVDWSAGFENEAFVGKRVGVYSDSIANNLLKKVIPEAVAVGYENIDQIKQDLKAGRIDAVLEGRIGSAQAFLTGSDAAQWKLSDRIVVDPSVGEHLSSAWLVQKGNTKLQKLISDALTAMVADCTYTKIRREFLPVPTFKDEPSCQ
jgi:ABC-type amino acid transport substrate-binding protein